MIESQIKYLGNQNGVEVFILYIPHVNIFEQRNQKIFIDTLLFLKARYKDERLITKEVLFKAIDKLMLSSKMNKMVVYFDPTDIPENIYRDIEPIKYLWKNIEWKED